jgi:hypothetical protein
MIVLPTANVAAKSSNPRKLLIYSHPKVGKTSAVSQLEGCLIVDLESSASFFGGMYLDVKSIAKQQKITMFEAFKQVIVALKTQVKESGVFYKYVCIDSLTILEEISKELALINYKASPVGKSFEGKDVFTLPNGAGELWFRNAMDSLYNAFDGLYSDALILIGHVKSSSINKGGQELQVRDLNVRGKGKILITAEMDAIAYLFRNKGKPENIISFIGDERDVTTGSRCKHLSNQEFVISEMIDGELVTYWNKIFRNDL